MPDNNSTRQKSSVALILIDVINHFEFPDGDRVLKNALPMANRLAKLKQRCRRAGIPAIYVNDNFGQWRSDAKSLVRTCLASDCAGKSFVEPLRPNDEDYFVLKPMHSAFFQTPLETLLHYLGATSLILTGLATNSCIVCTAHDAKMRNFILYVPSDCSAARTRREHEQAIEHIKEMTSASVIASSSLRVGELRGESRHRKRPKSYAEIADRLAGLAQLLSTQKENPYKVKAYHRAAARIRSLSESLDELVREEADLTQFPGIGEAIASAIREIVMTGKLRKLDTLRGQAPPEVARLADYPRLDPKRVLRVYKKLGISSIESLREKLESGEIESALGLRMAQHIRQGVSEAYAMLLYRADDLRDAIEEFLLAKCAVKAVQVVGAFRRRVEVIEEIAFVIESDDFPAVVRRMQRYGGRTALLESSADGAVFALAAGIILRLRPYSARAWGLCVIAETGSEAHLKKLQAVTGNLTSLSGKTAFTTETAFYRNFGLAYIEPELREGNDEVERAGTGSLPELVTEADIRGDLHAHSTSSDGVHSIEQMAAAARERGYEYIGISDHSQSLKIARGVSVEDLWQQIRYIDKLNANSNGIRILKSSEVDILADGSLDYPGELLKELDYTVCSIHSRFGLNREQQTERLMRAMDNRYFNILGHATGRLLLKRPGYEIDIDRIVDHARRNGCFFEINSSPDRLDLSADNARRAAAASVLIAVNTDSHSMGELQLVRRGLDQARRAGLAKTAVLAEASRSVQKVTTGVLCPPVISNFA